MSLGPKQTTTAFDPAIRRGRIEQLTIYEISEAELEKLEEGSPASLFLNFAIALLSMAVSMLVALFTTKIESLHVFVIFVVVTVVGLVVGLVLLALWHRQHVSQTKLAELIRRRAPPEGIPVGGALPPLLSTAHAELLPIATPSSEPQDVPHEVSGKLDESN